MGEERPPVVSVIGGAQCSPAEAEKARQVGRLLAERGVIVVCGGGAGVMEAVCRGVSEGKGFSIGILPGSAPEEGNRYLYVRLPTELGQARNAIVVLAGRAVIAIGGGYGTLSEIGLALRKHRRVIGLGTWRAEGPDGMRAEILEASSPPEAVELALSG
jgi:uncharacterized protein (TIGR00725 family)